jgi:ABC-type phosphate transport system substrate-binding protein
VRESRSSGFVSKIGAGVLAALLLGVAARGEADLRLTREEYPVVDGSTSTQPLGMLVAGRVTRTSVEWRRTSFFDPTRFLALTGAPYDDSRKLSLELTTAEPRATDLGTALSSIGQLAERVRHSGTNQSYARLATGQAELVLAARGPTPAEREAVRRGGTEIVVVPIARDAFVFLRHASNPVTGVTLDQVRDIYAGVLTSWKILGGADRPIVAYQRDATSGSQVEMEQLVMRGRPMREGPDIRVTMEMFGPFNAIRRDPAGIGYSYHYYERFMAVVPEVTTLAIDGILPERATIVSGRYPLATMVYLAHRADLPPGGAAARLRDWLRTPAGQAVIAESGYVPLRPGSN